MKTKELNATTLRMLLIVGLLLIATLCVASFFYARNNLRGVAEEVSRAVVDAEASSNNLQTLQQLQKELKAQQDTIARTNQIVAESKSYQYQNQIIADLHKYAKEADIRITNMDFGAPDSGSSAAASTPPPAPAAGAGTPPATAAAPSGVKSTSVSVTLENPVNYRDMLQFIRLIEQNLTKMQISRIGLSSDGSSNEVSSDSLTIEVYVR